MLRRTSSFEAFKLFEKPSVQAFPYAGFFPERAARGLALGAGAAIVAFQARAGLALFSSPSSAPSSDVLPRRRSRGAQRPTP